jgi:hypothetical protein
MRIENVWNGGERARLRPRPISPPGKRGEIKYRGSFAFRRNEPIAQLLLRLRETAGDSLKEINQRFGPSIRVLITKDYMVAAFYFDYTAPFEVPQNA